MGMRWGVSSRSGVADGLGAGGRVRLAVFEADDIAVLLGAAVGAEGATQAARESARHTKSNAFLIVVFAYYTRRITLSAQAIPGLWAHLLGFVAQRHLPRLQGLQKPRPSDLMPMRTLGIRET